MQAATSNPLLQQHRRFSLPTGRGFSTPLRGTHCSHLSARVSRCRAVKEFDLGTVYSGGKEANWLAPEGGSASAKGVVLFMHGFAQGPNAYYENLTQLADAGFLVVAPVPPFKPTPYQQQAAMVEYAAHFRSKLFTNTLPGLSLPSAVTKKVGLLGHSVGAGLATFVAQQAAQDKQPFKAVMYMAPQTQVVKNFDPATAISSWPAGSKALTEFGLQYGLKDDLAPPNLALALQADLKAGQLDIDGSDVTCFPDGTHVGFEDQVVLGDAEVTSDILPWLNPLLWWIITSLSALGVPFLPSLLGLIYKRGRQAAPEEETIAAAGGGGMLATASSPDVEMGIPQMSKMLMNPQDIALLQQLDAKRARYEAKPAELRVSAPADGIGPPEKVSIASAEASTAQYVGLLAVTIAAFLALGKKTLEGFGEGEIYWLPLLGTLLTGYFTYEGAYYLKLQNYVNTVQRPQSREKAKAFMIKHLL